MPCHGMLSALDNGGYKRVRRRFQDYSREIFDWISEGFGDRVIETVKVLSVNDVDCHFTGEPNQLFSARIRNAPVTNGKGESVSLID